MRQSEPTVLSILEAAREIARTQPYAKNVVGPIFDVMHQERRLRAERAPFFEAQRLVIAAMHDAGFSSFVDVDQRGSREDVVGFYDAVIAAYQAGD